MTYVPVCDYVMRSLILPPYKCVHSKICKNQEFCVQRHCLSIVLGNLLSLDEVMFFSPAKYIAGSLLKVSETTLK